MATQTQTQTAPAPSAPPEITILTRVASIPMISSSLETIDGALSSNMLTRSPYATAKGLSTTAYKMTEPLQVRLAPYITQVDGYANKAVDAVEHRYPYPFKAKPEEIAEFVRERRQSVVDTANKTINDNVKTPAYMVAQGIDQRFAPIVDYFEVAVSRLNSSEAGPSTSPDAKYQYQRALAISKTLKDNVYVYSNDQLKHLQAQSALVQRAMDTAQNITNVASSSLVSAQTRIHALSDNMMAELQRLQASTASFSASLQSTASTTIHNGTAQLQSQIPPQVQQAYQELSANLGSAVTELRNIVTTKDMPVQEKVSKVGHQVQDRVSPLLELVKKRLSDLMARGKAEAHVTPQGSPSDTKHTNGQASQQPKDQESSENSSGN